MDIPIGVMSYVKVPLHVKVGILWHKTNLTADGRHSVNRDDLKRKHGGRARIFTDGFWRNKDEWVWSLTDEGTSFVDPETQQLEEPTFTKDLSCTSL